MALIVEDGTGLAGAESLCSVDFADAYLGGLGLSLWATMSTTEKEQALRRATTYMQVYRMSWAGWRVTTTQALDWPRDGVELRDGPGGWGYGFAYLASNVVPIEVRQACAKLAYKAAGGELVPDEGQTAIRVKVGPIEKEFAQGSSATKRFPEIDRLLRPLLKGAAGGNSASVVRS